VRGRADAVEADPRGVQQFIEVMHVVLMHQPRLDQLVIRRLHDRVVPPRENAPAGAGTAPA
jgi:hypothetical protein